jgi:hypothetical protein
MADEFNDQRDAISAAWAKGKRSVTLKIGKREIRFNLKLDVRNPRFQVGGETKTQTEKWIIATPSDGSALPTFSVAPHGAKGNTRVAVGK